MAIPDRISREWLEEDIEGPYEPSDEFLEDAETFCLMKWKERARELGVPEPTDLSYSCKFTSLFLRELIGGEIKGNAHHQFLELDGEIYDLNNDAKDVQQLDRPWDHDPVFFGNPDHLDSIESCVPRVRDWVDGFVQKYCATPLNTF